MITAESFREIFYRNAINWGLLAATVDIETVRATGDEDDFRTDPTAEPTTNVTTGEEFRFDELEEPKRASTRPMGRIPVRHAVTENFSTGSDFAVALVSRQESS